MPTRLPALLLTAILALPATLLAQPASVPQRVTDPMPKLGEGTRIRVWTDAVGQLRVLSSTPERHEGRFLRWDGDSLTFELNEAVATVVDLDIGRMTTENTVPVLRISRLERQRIGTTPTRLTVGLTLGAIAGGALAVTMDSCGRDGGRCSAGERVAGGVVTFGLVTGAVAIRRFWEEVPLPGR